MSDSIPISTDLVSENSLNVGIKSRNRNRIFEFIAEKMIAMVAFLSLAFMVLIFIFVFREAFSLFFTKHSDHSQIEISEMETYGSEFVGEGAAVSDDVYREADESQGLRLFGYEWQPVSLIPRYGILPLFFGSLKITFIAIFIAGPIAIFAALYTTAFAPKWSKEILKPSIEILAGFPSVVIGFFALTILATFFQQVFGYQYRLNAFVGGAALSLAVIPIIYTIAEDSLAAVPKSLTEATLALGATKWETVLFVLLPAATPGVFAAILLGIGRAFGETMIILMATGNAALISFNPFEPVRTMSATIGAEMAEVVFGDSHYGVLFLIGTILFCFSFSLNAVAEFVIRHRLLRKFGGNT